DPAGEDDEGLADRQRADHHHLLDDEREVAGGEESIRPDGEECGCEDERGQRTDDRAADEARPGAGSGHRPRPQQLSGPNAGAFASTPASGLSVMSMPPVSV